MKFLITLILFATVTIMMAEAHLRAVEKFRSKETISAASPIHSHSRHRARRVLKEKGQIFNHGQKQGGKVKWNVNDQIKITGNKHGNIQYGGGSNKGFGKAQEKLNIGKNHWG